MTQWTEFPQAMVETHFSELAGTKVSGIVLGACLAKLCRLLYPEVQLGDIGATGVEIRWVDDFDTGVRVKYRVTPRVLEEFGPPKVL